ncbi:DUF624 domain-containing protein [Enterococcus sp. LJL98]
MLQRLSSPLYKGTIFVGTLFLVNCLILLTNVPFVFSLIFIPKASQNLIPIVLSACFMGPSVAAGYSVIWRYMNTGEYEVWQRFWQSYRYNFRQGMGISVILCLIASLLLYNIQTIFVLKQMTLFFYPTLILLFLLPFLFFLAILLISRFDVSNRNVLTNTLFFMIQNPLISLKNGLTLLLFFLLVYLTGWKLFYTLLFSLPIYLILLNVRLVLRSIETEKGFKF